LRQSRNEWSKKIYENYIKLADEGKFDQMNTQIHNIQISIANKESQIADLKKELIEINQNIASLIV